MGAIARNIANKITTSGVFTSGAITNSSVTGITVLANASDGITFISSQTASATATISFTGLSSTYKAYKFVFVNIHPATDMADFSFNLSTDSGSNYNVTKTSTYFKTQHQGSTGLYAEINYFTTGDLAQSTGFQRLTEALDNDNSSSMSGSLTLFNPSSTTYVKHFLFVDSEVGNDVFAVESFVAGYGNTTSAVNAIQFKFDTGNIDAGTIYMYGIK